MPTQGRPVLGNFALSREQSAAEPIFAANFYQAFGRSAVLGAIYEPLQEIVPGQSEQAVEAGLRAMCYPRSYDWAACGRNEIERSVELAHRLRASRDLLAGVRHSEDYELTTLRATLLDEHDARIQAREKISRLRPKSLGRLCAEHGVSLDELALRRAWRTGRRDRYEELELAGGAFSVGALTAKLVEADFTRKTRTPGGWTSLISNDELPPALRAPGMINLKRRLPPKSADEPGERWEFCTRRDGVAKHVIYPVIRWSEPRRDSSRAVKLEYNQPRPVYNSLRREVEHFSPLLGALLLAAELDTDLIAHELSRGERRARGHFSEPRLDKSRPARLLELVHRPAIAEQLTRTNRFGELRTVAHDLSEQA